MKPLRSLAGTTLILAMLAGAALPAPAQYAAYDLGLGRAYDINSAGTIVGYYEGGGWYRAFSYTSGVMTDLGPGQAYGINDAGTIVGWSDYNPHAFSYSGGVMTDLGTFGGSSAEATRINSTGTIVGDYVSSGGYPHAFGYGGGVLTDLGPGRAYGINDAGTIVGGSYTSGGAEHAFSYSGGVMTDLGTLGGASSEAWGINNGGTIIGWSQVSVDYIHAFSYSGGVMTDLGTLGGGNSVGLAINSAGTIVGWSSTSGFDHPFSYSGGVMTDLGPYLANLGLTWSSYAIGINDNGDIVGYGLAADGFEHAFLLVMPEPSTWALLALGGAALLLRRRK